MWLGWIALAALVASSTIASDRMRAHASPAAALPSARGIEPVLKRQPATLTEPRHAHTVVVLVIDGIRWQEVFSGADAKLARSHGIKGPRATAAELVPNLHLLSTRKGAVVGAPGVGPSLLASGPVYRSLPGYMELLSGRPAEYCLSNRCGSVRYPTLMDQVGRNDPGQAALFASWPYLIHAAALNPAGAVLSTGQSGGSNLDRVYRSKVRMTLRAAALAAGPSPSKGDFRADAFTAALALDYLHDEHPRLLFISIGEADVFGHANNYGAYLAALRQADGFVGELLDATERLNGSGHATTLIVTTDHGRDRHAREHGPDVPESARVWAMASGFGVYPRGAVPLGAPKTLSAIAPSVLCLLGLGSAAPGLPELFKC